MEWFQVVAMRYRDPATIPSTQPTDVWDVPRIPERYRFLDQTAYSTILRKLEGSLSLKGSGEQRNAPRGDGATRVAMTRAAAAGEIVLGSAGGAARSSNDPVRNTDDAVWAAAQAIAAQRRAAPINNPDATVLPRGAGLAVAKSPPPYVRQTLHEYMDEDERNGKGKGKRSPWDRVRRVFRGDQQDRSPSTSPAHSSMPSLVNAPHAEQEIIHVSVRLPCEHLMNEIHALCLIVTDAQLSLVAARATLLRLGLAVAVFLMLHRVLVIFLNAFCMPRKQGVFFVHCKYACFTLLFMFHIVIRI